MDAVGIRKVSELTGLSIDTLRWYEREGLLPLVEREPGGRRRYSPAAVRFVRLVQALRRTGMPVQDVRAFVRMGSGVEWHGRRAALLEEHAEAIERHIAQLQRDLTVVRDKIAHHRELAERGLDCEDEIDLAEHGSRAKSPDDSEAGGTGDTTEE
ncbi:MerR family transcriptional regulator [Streptomyces oceani]|uniref:MerR family transcriptional regulator n=1 Tax=Streptomyces oceani TaxID=1075402 RepID=A0A1E7KI53_9ACTN|nr:MerR family transcriptional regulator [Streptomyces oceani]